MSATTFAQIAEFGKRLMGENEIEKCLELVSDEAKVLIEAERCSIFMVDGEANMLWSKHSDGIGRIAIGLDSGIAGDTYKTQKPQIVNKPYEDARFMSKIDAKSGFVTRNILTIPIFSSKRDVIGVIQLLNKVQGEFDQHDVDTLTFFANFVSGTLELAMLQGE